MPPDTKIRDFGVICDTHGIRRDDNCISLGPAWGAGVQALIANRNSRALCPVGPPRKRFRFSKILQIITQYQNLDDFTEFECALSLPQSPGVRDPVCQMANTRMCDDQIDQLLGITRQSPCAPATALRQQQLPRWKVCHDRAARLGAHP